MMLQVNPYLVFNGNAAKAFDFYKSVFGGEFAFVLKAKELPPAQGADRLDPAEAEKLLHICLPLPTGQLLQGSDWIHSFCAESQKFISGNNHVLNIRAESPQEASDLFKKLSDGASIQMDLQPMFWGDLYGQLIDQFGIIWSVNTPLNKPDDSK